VQGADCISVIGDCRTHIRYHIDWLAPCLVCYCTREAVNRRRSTTLPRKWSACRCILSRRLDRPSVHLSVCLSVSERVCHVMQHATAKTDESSKGYNELSTRKRLDYLVLQSLTDFWCLLLTRRRNIQTWPICLWTNFSWDLGIFDSSALVLLNDFGRRISVEIRENKLSISTPLGDATALLCCSTFCWPLTCTDCVILIFAFSSQFLIPSG